MDQLDEARDETSVTMIHGTRLAGCSDSYWVSPFRSLVWYQFCPAETVIWSKNKLQSWLEIFMIHLLHKLVSLRYCCLLCVLQSVCWKYMTLQWLRWQFHPSAPSRTLFIIWPQPGDFLGCALCKMNSAFMPAAEIQRWLEADHHLRDDLETLKIEPGCSGML